MSKTYFDTVDGADLSGFLKALHHFIATEFPVGDIHTQQAQTRGDELISQVGAIAGPVGPSMANVLRFLAQLETSGRFDKVLFGKDSISGQTQPYSISIEDLSTIDPHCNAVSVMRYKKGNPWFGLNVSDIETDTATIRIFERRVRKKKTEISWSSGMNPREIQPFLWTCFAACPAGVQFSDSPSIDAAVFPELAKVFPIVLQFSEQAAFFEAPNSYLAVHFTSLGWVAAITIPDVRIGHAFTPAILTMLDIPPKIVENEVARVLATL